MNVQAFCEIYVIVLCPGLWNLANQEWSPSIICILFVVPFDRNQHMLVYLVFVLIRHSVSKWSLSFHHAIWRREAIPLTAYSYAWSSPLFCKMLAMQLLHLDHTNATTHWLTSSTSCSLHASSFWYSFFFSVSNVRMRLVNCIFICFRTNHHSFQVAYFATYSVLIVLVMIIIRFLGQVLKV